VSPLKDKLHKFVTNYVDLSTYLNSNTPSANSIWWWW